MLPLVVLGTILLASSSSFAVQRFSAVLTGAQEVPPSGSSGTGYGYVVLNDDQTSITLYLGFTGLSSNATLSHIHTGAAGANGPVTFDFTSALPAATSGTIPAQTFAITPAQVATLQAGGMYFNIHTTMFGGGEIRGQIGGPSCTTAGPIEVESTGGTTVGVPTAYANLGAAFTAINAGALHAGAINVEVCANSTEPGTAVLNSNGAGTASYTNINIYPVADGVTISGPSAQGRGLIELNGADNVVIDGDNPNTAGTNRNLTIQNTAANTVTFTSVIRVALAITAVTSADNNAFRNLNVLGSATGRNVSTATSTTASENTTFGIFAGPGASTTDQTAAPVAITSVITGVAAGATASNLFIENNNVRTAARAVSINGSATSVYPGLQINGNSIGNPTAADPDQVYAIGITAQGSTNAVISNNTVWVEGFVASSAAGHGINVGVNSVNVTGATIERNRVNRVRNNNTQTFSAFGINLGGGSSHIVRNNFVSGVMNDQTAGTGGFGTTFGAYGIRIASGTGHFIYHNSVHLYGPLLGVTSTNLTAAFLMSATGQTGVDVRNNIFSNQVAGGNPTGTRNVSVFLPSGGTATMNLTLNNNAYFVGTDALNRLAQVGTVFGAGEFTAGNFDPTQTTPATNFRAYTSTLSAAGTNDNASFASTAPPPFTSNTDLHIPAATATRLESGGAAVGVTQDIDLEARNATTPDIGADEFAGTPPAANDIAAVGFVNPVNGSTIPTGANFTPQARFSNNGTATQTNVTVRFRIIDAGMTTIYNQTATIASIAPLQNVDVSFPPTSIATAGTYSMIASSELAGDANPANDAVNGTFNTIVPLGGTIDVGTGQTYTSLTNPGGLFEALNLAGISSNTTINITSDLTGETGAVALNQLAEAGAGGYTVTIKPSGAARTISGTAASLSLIKLNGADRITIDGSLNGGTDRSLTILYTNTGGTVVWIASQNAGNGANNNTVRNCIIASNPGTISVAGILAGSGTTLGGQAEAQNNNNTIQNNQIFRVQNAIFHRGALTLDQNWLITGNRFGSDVVADKNSFRGMLTGDSQNFIVSNNIVRGISSTATTTAAMTGIQLAFVVSGGTVTGNVISDIRNNSASGTGAFGMQLSAAAGTTNNTIANNFISDAITLGSATIVNNGHGININAAAPTGAYKIYHNTINMNTNQTTGTTSAINLTSAVVAAGAVDLRNNILVNLQTSGATRFAVFSAAAATVFTPIDYNDYFAPNVGFIGGSARVTLADWQAATAQDVNSIAGNPSFVSVTDFHITSTSPARNVGTPVGIGTDIDNQIRPNPSDPPVQVDMGADEFYGPTGVNEPLYATDGTTITSFNSATPGTITVVTVTGMQSGETLVGIDLRPSTGQLFGIGSTSRMYTIDPVTGAAVQVGTAGAFTLNGVSFGTDFNPTVDRVRQVSDTEQNIRLNPNDGTLAGSDTALNPPGSVVAVAYDRNDNNTTTPTTLYGIDSASGNLVMIGGPNGTPSPNLGVITVVGSLGLGTNLDPALGFDISGTTGIAYATISDSGPAPRGDKGSSNLAVNPRLYTINLATGQATLVGLIGNGSAGAYPGVTAASRPTAAGVSVSGHVRMMDGRGLTNAQVTLSDMAGNSRVAVTGRNGAFLFAEVEAGQTYIISVASRRYTFSPKVIEVNDNVTDVDFYPVQ